MSVRALRRGTMAGRGAPPAPVVTRIEITTAMVSGFPNNWPSASHSDGNAVTFNTGPCTVPFTVAAGKTAVLECRGPTDGGGGTGAWNLDSGAQTGTYSNNAATGYQQLLFTSAPGIAAGSHSLVISRTTGTVYLDYVEITET